jgi:hypothetical protein
MDLPLPGKTPASVEDQTESNSGVGVINEPDPIKGRSDDRDWEALSREHQERVKLVEVFDGA